MTQQKSKPKPKPDNVVPIKYRLCVYHRSASERDPVTFQRRPLPAASCEPGTCQPMNNQLEQEALLEAASEIADSLVSAAEKEIARIQSKDIDAAAEAAVRAAAEAATAVGSHLAAALTIRVLLSQVRSDFLNPMWVPGPEGEDR